MLTSKSNFLQVLEQLNTNDFQLSIIFNEDKKVIGVMTDGDIRRAFLNGKKPKDKIDGSVNTDFEFLYVDQLDNMKEKLPRYQALGINAIPILTKDNYLESIVNANKLQLHEQSRSDGIRAFIFAGGFGKRLMPLTENIPKPMLDINGKPILELIIENIAKAGVKKFTLSTFYKKEVIQNYFQSGTKLSLDINYLQEDIPMGTAGALSLLEDEDFEVLIISNGDILTKLDFDKFLNYHKKNKAFITVASVDHNVKIDFGVIKHSKSGSIEAIQEKPVKSFLISAGIYIFSKKAVKRVKQFNKYIDMPDMINELINEGEHIVTFPLHEYWSDIGTIEQLEKTRKNLIDG